MSAAVSEVADWTFADVPRRPADAVLILGEEAAATATTVAPAVARVVVGPDGLASGADSFATVLCRSVLCRHTDPRQVLEAIRRVLSPGGWLGLIEPVASEQCAVADEQNRAARRADPTLVRALSASALQDTLVRCGFEVAGARTWELSASEAPRPAAPDHAGGLDTMTSLLVLNPGA